MMKIIDIDDFLAHVKAITETRSYLREFHINEAREMHRKHTRADLNQLSIEAEKMTKGEIKALFMIGLRNPARIEITRLMIQKELKDRALLDN